MIDIDKTSGRPSLTLHFQGDDDGECVQPYLHECPDDQSEISTLSTDERDLLIQCETDIEDGLDTFLQVGFRLHQIKAKKLYRESHRSFGAYCKEKWGISSVHARRQINAAQTVNLLKSEPIGSVSVPTTESAARPIAKLPVQDQIKAAQIVKNKVGEATPSANDFKEAAKPFIGGTAPDHTSCESKDEPGHKPLKKLKKHQNENVVELAEADDLPSFQLLKEAAIRLAKAEKIKQYDDAVRRDVAFLVKSLTAYADLKTALMEVAA